MSSNRNDNHEKFKKDQLEKDILDIKGSWGFILIKSVEDKNLLTAISVDFNSHIQKIRDFSPKMYNVKEADLLKNYGDILENTKTLATTLLAKLETIKPIDKKKKEEAVKVIKKAMQEIGDARVNLLKDQRNLQRFGNQANKQQNPTPPNPSTPPQTQQIIMGARGNLQRFGNQANKQQNPTPPNPSTPPQRQQITMGASRLVAKTADLQKTPLDTNSMFHRPTSAKPPSEHEVLMKIKKIVESQFWEGKAYRKLKPEDNNAGSADSKELKDIAQKRPLKNIKDKRPLGISKMAKILENYPEKISNPTQILEEISKIAEGRLSIKSKKTNSFKESQSKKVDEFYKVVLGTDLNEKNAKLESFELKEDNKKELNLNQNKVEQKSPMRPGKK